MGLGLPDGGHLTHGYYVSLTFSTPSHVLATECSKSTPSLLKGR